MGMPARHYYTAADVLAMPEDGNKYEVVHGELLVSPVPRPRHQFVLFRLVQAIANFLDRFPVGHGATGGDLLVVGKEEAAATKWSQVKNPLLVVEILSPSSIRQDRFTKRRLYQEVGIPLFWLVDADASTVEVWTPDRRFPVTETESITWHPEGAGERLVIRLGDLFRLPSQR